jgi:hypothetical protein
MDPQRPVRSASPRPASRRRVSKRTYLVRRIVALVMVVAVVSGVVVVAKALFGGGTSTAADSTVVTGPSTAIDTSTSAVDGVAPVDPTVTTLTSETTIADPGTVPTAADPARVLLVGDSEAGGLSPFLSKVLKATGVVTMSVDYKSSTGLVRPDFFDWPTRLRSTVPTANPDIVVALFGGNDGQPFPGLASFKVDSPEWRTEYAKRVGDLMDFLSADGRTLVWVGVPNALDDKLTANLTVQNEVVKGEVAKRPKVIFVDSWQKFVGLDGSFAPYILDPRDGEFKAVRSEKDGFHLNTVGEEILAQYVGDAVITDLRTRGAAI